MTEPMVVRSTTDVSTEAEPTPGRDRVQRRWMSARPKRNATSTRTLLLVGVAVLLAAALVSATQLESDDGSDLLGLIRGVALDALKLRWQFLLVVLGLAALHYLATAIALRAAATCPLPLGETGLVQLAASAANRITPVGLGGAAVNLRYLTRRGVDTPAAAGAVGALTIFGGIADFGVFIALVLGGPWLGLNGAGHELRTLVALVTRGSAPWIWTALFAVVVLLVVLARRGRFVATRVRISRLLLPTRALLHRPRDLATLLVASGSTTLILGLAFVATTAMVPGHHPSVGIGALLVAFMIGSVAGSSVPVPAGLGSTEAALTAVLISVQVAPAQAVHVVLIFRLLTFWVPAVLGIGAARLLYRRGAL